MILQRVPVTQGLCRLGIIQLMWRSWSCRTLTCLAAAALHLKSSRLGRTARASGLLSCSTNVAGSLSYADASIPVKKPLSHGEHSSQEAGPITGRAMLQLSIFILKTVFIYVTYPLMSDTWPKAPVVFPRTYMYIAFSSCLQNRRLRCG